jgi:hypothetical protein
MNGRPTITISKHCVSNYILNYNSLTQIMSGKATKHGRPVRVTGKELTEVEELSAMLDVLVEDLERKGIIHKKEYNRLVAMRLHEISKAKAFEELDEEL